MLVFNTQFTYTFIAYMAVRKFICLVKAKSTYCQQVISVYKV